MERVRTHPSHEKFHNLSFFSQNEAFPKVDEKQWAEKEEKEKKERKSVLTMVR